MSNPQPINPLPPVGDEQEWSLLGTLIDASADLVTQDSDENRQRVREAVREVRAYEKKRRTSPATTEAQPRLRILPPPRQTMRYVAGLAAVFVVVFGAVFVANRLSQNNNINGNNNIIGRAAYKTTDNFGESRLQKRATPEPPLVATEVAPFITAIEENPDAFEGYYNRGNTYAALGLHEEAIADYTRALELNPQYANAYYNRGNSYFILNDLEAALADYTQTIAIDQTYVDAFYNQGNTLARQGNFASAIASYNQVTELDATYTNAFYNRGNAHVRLENLDAAIADYTRTIELDPTYANAFYNRGLAYTDQGDFSAALADFERYLELVGGDSTSEDRELVAEIRRRVGNVGGS